MKLQAQSSNELNKALQKSTKCIKAKNILPVLDNALLTCKGSQFFLTTSTGDAQLTVPVPFSLVEGKLAEPIALPVSLIMPFLSTLPDCVVTFTFEENGTNALHIEYCTNSGDVTKEGKASLTYTSGKEFPLLATLKEGATHIILPTAILNEAVGGGSEAVCTNDLRPALGCICIDIADDLHSVSFVATNGNNLYRLCHTNDTATGGSDFFRSGQPRQMLLHYSNFRTLGVFDGCDTVDVEGDGNVLRFSSADGIEFMCKSVEQRYPNYKAVIPQNSPNYICVDRKEMLTILKRVSLFGSKAFDLVSLSKDGLFAKVAAEDVDFSRSAEDQVTVVSSSCEDGFRIGFGVSNLTAALTSIGGDTLRIAFRDASHAVVFTEDTPSPRSLALVMPKLVG